MATRMILKNGDPQLRKHCHEVTDFNPRLHMLLDDMRQTLAESNGVGLAAPQVGVLRRAVIVLETNVPDDEEEYMIELINPVIVETAGEQTGAEGCLSIPNEFGVVQRPDGSRYIKGPRCVIFGYDTCPEDTDPSLPGNTPFTGDCVFCGDFGHDVYHCPILDELESSEAYQELLQNNG